MKNYRVSQMWLWELISFINSDEFRDSLWANDCLFPPLNRYTVTNHPLMVAERVTARRKITVFVMILLIPVIASLFSIVMIWEKHYPNGGFLAPPLISVIFSGFTWVYCLYNVFMSPEEKKSLRRFREHLTEWEKLLNSSLGDYIEISRLGVEQLVRTRLVETAKGLLEIEGKNALKRENNNLSSIDLDKEKRAKERLEDFHGLVRCILADEKWDRYFQIAKEELAKEEAARKVEEDKKHEPICEGDC